MEPIHDRMPVILQPEDEALWLNPGADESRLKQLLLPYPASEMEAYVVSRVPPNGLRIEAAPA
jgi:putative SOS response-associated peptidase YedK